MVVGKVKKIFIINFILIILIKLFLEYSYIHYVYKYFEYDGFYYILNSSKYIFGWLVYILGYIILYKKSYIYLYEAFLFLFLLYITPNIVYYSLSNQNTFFFLAIILPYFIILLTITNKSIIKLKSLNKGKPVVLFISFLLTSAVIIHYIISTGGHIVSNLKDVYIFRKQFDVYSSSGIFGYLNSWAGKIFAVILLAWAIQRKKIILIITFSIFIILLFIFSGHKGVLQGIVLVPFFYYLFKIKNRDTIIIFAFLSLIILSLVIGEWLNIPMLPSLLIRRLLFLPAQINFWYFDFFSQHEFFYWSNSIMKYFINNPYGVQPPLVIGEYVGYPDADMNTGFIASGFAHAGYIGIIIYTVLSIIILNLINSFGKKIDKYIVMSIIFISLKALFISSDMLTTLLTHGLLISIVVLWMYDNKNYILKIGKVKYKI